MSAESISSHPVVFLHGVGGSARAWTPQLASFSAAGLGTVALDLPGSGHLPNLEAPARFDAAVLDFLRGVSSPSRSSAANGVVGTRPDRGHA